MVGCHPLLHDLFAAQARQGQAPNHGLFWMGGGLAARVLRTRERVVGQWRRRRVLKALRVWLSGITDVLEARSLERQEPCLPLLDALCQWPPRRWPGATAALPPLAHGRLLMGLGRYGQAEKALQTGLELARQRRGSEAAALQAGCLGELAGLARERGQVDRAETLARQALAVLEAAGQRDALVRAEALNALGLALDAQAKPEAEPVLREALNLRLKHLDDSDRQVQFSRNNLAMALRKQGRAAEAEGLYEQVLETVGEEICEVGVTVRHNLSFAAEAAGDLERALSLRQQAVALAADAMGEDHPTRGLLMLDLGVLAEQLGRLAEAEAHYRRAAALTTAAWGADDPLSQHCQQTLEAFLAAPAPDPPASPPSDPAESSA
jgi:tetratricopeptide (TPR) repeat protein